MFLLSMYFYFKSTLDFPENSKKNDFLEIEF